MKNSAEAEGTALITNWGHPTFDLVYCDVQAIGKQGDGQRCALEAPNLPNQDEERKVT